MIMYTETEIMRQAVIGEYLHQNIFSIISANTYKMYIYIYNRLVILSCLQRSGNGYTSCANQNNLNVVTS